MCMCMGLFKPSAGLELRGAMRLEYEVCRKAAALIVLQGHHTLKILIDFKMAHLQYIEGIRVCSSLC